MHRTPRERASEADAFRRIDTSLRGLVTELVRALAGLTVAYLAGRWLAAGPLGLGGSPRDVALAAAVHVGLAGAALFVTSAHPIRRDLDAHRRAVLVSERALLDRVAEQGFLSDVHDAFEMGATEADALGVVAVALGEAHDGPAELLLADSSRAHLRRSVTVAGHDAPGCQVETPWECPAVRRGQSLRFEDSTALGACPRLRGRGEGSISAVCVPVTILGTPTAVLHATSPAAGTDSGDGDGFVMDRLEGIAAQLGARLGVLRAMARSQLQAETDPLTGLLNRRALEERVRSLRLSGAAFAVAMADLDNFKQLNDRHGHESGDRALRTFARVVREAVRDEDLVSRHGGEEFVVVLPGLDAGAAVVVLERIREQLREAVGSASIPAFTVSVGVADSTSSSELGEILRAADQALLAAKAAGRDRLVVSTDPPSPRPTGLTVA